MRTEWMAGCAGVLALCAIGVAAAQGNAERVIESRVAGFRDIGSAYKNIGDELKSGRPNRKEIQTSAGVIATYSRHVPNWFPAGSAPVRRAPKGWLETIRGWFSFGDPAPAVGEAVSKAKPEIWTRRGEFDRAAKQFSQAAIAMRIAAQRGDPREIAASHRQLGATCKSCHDRFREEDD